MLDATSVDYLLHQCLVYIIDPSFGSLTDDPVAYSDEGESRPENSVLLCRAWTGSLQSSMSRP